MFISKKHLSRRTVLRGLGATIALPLLDAMVPAATALAQTAASPKPRVGFFYLPHGAIMRDWTPDAVGREFDLKPILKPLEPFKHQMTIVSGLGNKPAESSAVHAITPGTWLSCVPPRRSNAPFCGVTADQVAAKYIGQDTALPSLEVATEEKGGASACDGTYGCSLGTTISFSAPDSPLPMEFNPKKFFVKLFGQGSSPEERTLIANDYKSVLDMVMNEAATLKRSVGASDRVMLDNYLTSVREIERRVHNMETRDLSQFDLPEMPVGIPDFDKHIELMFDMIALAYQADMTRVVSFMMAAEVSNQAYTHIGIPDAFHPLSHHNNSPVNIDKLSKLQTWHSEVIATFLGKLADLPDGDGSILDHSLFLYGGNMSNSNNHDHFPLPSVVLGGGCGKVKGHQHLKYDDRTPLANLLLTMLNRVGVPVEQHGDSTGMFAEV
ncbi:MAG: DUF1552 domain-containing protein [Gammaproteobacteria bacterium]|nr:DUF1552 domain-containing protein [Gammaproteobacteria bacterium]